MLLSRVQISHEHIHTIEKTECSDHLLCEAMVDRAHAHEVLNVFAQREVTEQNFERLGRVNRGATSDLLANDS